MKKIGILTFQSAVNYGAVLQAYALVENIRALGAEAELIDYHYPSETEMTTFKGRFHRGLKKGVEFLLIYPGWCSRRKKFQFFLRSRSVLSSREYNAENISCSNGVYDAFIVGSDQMWNLPKVGYDYNYFLKFVDDSEKKFSYAVSSGTLSEQLVEAIGDYGASFHGISVREADLQKLCEEKLSRNIELLVDPVFLMEKEKWEKLAIRPRQKGYILVYGLEKSVELITFARNLSNQTGKRIIYLNVRAERYIGMKNISNAGVEQFLGYYLNADYVVTNSFHGTAFGILLNKELYVCNLKNENMGNSRLLTVLEKFGLTNRLINSNEQNICLNRIDYSKVNKNILCEKQKANEYLKAIIC